MLVCWRWGWGVDGGWMPLSTCPQLFFFSAFTTFFLRRLAAFIGNPRNQVFQWKWRADSRPERANSRPERADFRPERADFRPERQAWAIQYFFQLYNTNTILPNIGTIQYNTNTIQYQFKIDTIHCNCIQYITIDIYISINLIIN